VLHLHIYVLCEDKFGDTDENSENVACVLTKNLEQALTLI
jgi:hypothetical protein